MNKEYRFFEYISDIPDKDNFRFVLKLSDYISHQLVEKHMSIKSLNKLDRIKKAEFFLSDNKDYFKRHNKTVYALIENKIQLIPFIQEIALLIDLKIPYFYFMKKNNISNQNASKHYKGINQINENLNYHFKESYKLESQIYKEIDYERKAMEENTATRKQLSYLKALLKNTGYVLKIDYDDLNRYEAYKLISFLKDDTELDEELLAKLLEYAI